MSDTQFKNAQRVWDAFMRVVILAPFGGAGWATTRQIADNAGMSKPTVQKYMLMARDEGRVRFVQIGRNQVVWEWVK